ncbi:hypothetical protein ACE1AT_21330 [Pelatocladus sp. BLCC-F211]|uniref:hypothetical protein n=1 Tax=Pelatocladus sp. BLCC-F211 TaxID=3342752 RepID=UPI0035BA878C
MIPISDKGGVYSIADIAPISLLAILLTDADSWIDVSIFMHSNIKLIKEYFPDIGYYDLLVTQTIRLKMTRERKSSKALLLTAYAFCQLGKFSFNFAIKNLPDNLSDKNFIS